MVSAKIVFNTACVRVGVRSPSPIEPVFPLSRVTSKVCLASRPDGVSPEPTYLDSQVIWKVVFVGLLLPRHTERDPMSVNGDTVIIPLPLAISSV